MYQRREGGDGYGTAAGAVRRLGGRTEQWTGTGEMGGLANSTMSGAARRGIRTLVGNDKAHGRTYKEGQRMYGRVSGNCYPFQYVKYT